jgi:hypothetical protein
VFIGTPAAAEHPVAAAQRLQQEATAAYRNGDYESFTRSLERALALNPSSFATMYNLACGYARTGRDEEALELLQRLTAAQVDFGMAADPDLASLRDLPRFRELVATLAETIVPVGNSVERLTIDQLGLMPEGIALDPVSRRLFLGSMRTGDVLVVGTDGTWSRFASVGEEGPYSAIGMTVDVDRGLLWVVGTWFFMAEGYDAEQPRPSGLFGFDLADGRLRHEFHADVDAGGLNDVTVAPNGDVFVSGTQLHVLRAGSDAFEAFVTTPEPFGSNGLAVSADGGTLFVSSYPVGIGAIDLETGALRYLEAPAERPVYGIDGLYWYDGDLVGIQNGLQPWRLLRMELDADRTRIGNVRVIEFANPALTPTTGAVDGHRLHYVGQGPAPEERPGQFPEALAPFLGRTVIMTADLAADR